MQVGNVTPINNGGTSAPSGGSTFSLSTPAGWAMIYFVASVVILSIMFLSA